MGSSVGGNPNPWAPYDTYRDCSQGICSIYCPQWCYLIFPPPPPSSSSFFDDSDDHSSSNFSPLIIALIGVLASAFLLVSYYALVSKFCRRRRDGSAGETGRIQSVSDLWRGTGSTPAAAGLDETLIKSIAVYKYRKSDGVLDCTDCSVCLSEFEENESLRLLPKCNHAFHAPCIDTWLKSHSNCPLCRANIAAVVSDQPNAEAPISVAAPLTAGGSNTNAEISISTMEYRHRTDDFVLVIEDLESVARDEAVLTIPIGHGDGSQEKPPERDARLRVRGGHGEMQPIRRSVSLNSSPMCNNAIVSIADILQQHQDDEEESNGIGFSDEIEKTANQRNGVSSFLIRSSQAMKRSVSTGRFFLSRYDRGRNCSLPN